MKKFRFVKTPAVLLAIIFIIFTACTESPAFAAAATGAASGTWQKDDYGWWYLYDSGGCASDTWEYIDGQWYYFDANGYMQTGWVYDGSWYYLNNAGAMTTGWMRDGDSWYYFHPDGHLTYGGWVVDTYGRLVFLGDDGVYIPDNLTWIGDSLSARTYGYREISQSLYSADIVAMDWKCFAVDQENNPSGLSIASQMMNEGTMRDYLVFQLGTNDAWKASEVSSIYKGEWAIEEGWTAQKAARAVEDLRNILGYDRRIVFVTACYYSDDQTAARFSDINNIFRQLAASDPNIAVADWEEQCNLATDTADGLHQNAQGARKFVQLIQDAIISKWGAT